METAAEGHPEGDAADAFATLTIDLDAVGENWRQLARRAAPAECGAVVKADAYGLGIAQVVPALARAGCRTFFTAHVSEGRRARISLREAGLDEGARIFVLNGFRPEAQAPTDFPSFELGPVIGSAEELASWEAFAASAPDAPLFSALHVDTGMNRLGFPVAEARLLPHARLATARVGLIMSHFVSAEAPLDRDNAEQIGAFEHARERALRHFPASIANSSGIFLPQRPHYDLVRPGYALYGGNPTPGSQNPMRAAVSLSARLLQVRTVPAGASAGYNARWTAKRLSRLGTIGVGYADGLPVGASGIGGAGATVYCGERPCPLVGRVSMDLSIVDLTEAPVSSSEQGCSIELLGHHVDIDTLGQWAGTIGYEILTNLGRRYRRCYLGNGAR